MPLRKNLHTKRYKVQTKSKNRKLSLLLLLFTFLGIGLVYSVSARNSAKSNMQTETPKQNPIEKIASEVKEVATPKPKKDPEKLITDVEAYLGTQQGEFGYQVIELESGQSFGERQDNRYVAASTVKVGVAAYVYKQIELGKIKPDTLLTYTSADYETGTGSLQGTKIGSRYKVSYLLERMIKVSDNVATNILIRTYGRSNIQAYLNANGLSEITMSKNEVSPAVMARLLEKIYKAEIISESSRDQLVALMTGSLDSTRIVAGVPKSVTVAHKIGTQVATINDIGIVYLPKNNYVLSVYSKKITNETTAKNVIKNISQKVYEYESKD